MYRKRNGSLGFSFTRFAHAAVPNFFEDPPISRSADLTAYRRDMCYMHQITSASPYALDKNSFYVAGIADSHSVSQKIYVKLRKHEILREDGTIDTFKIGPKFPHQMAMLDLRCQKDLVGMLFWWEEECQRLRKLEAEEKELDVLVKEAEVTVDQSEEDSAERHDGKGRLDQMKFARERIRMKRRQRPSQRRPDVEADKDDILAAFHGRSKSVPNVGSGVSGGGEQSSAQPKSQEELGKPPMYFAVS